MRNGSPKRVGNFLERTVLAALFFLLPACDRRNEQAEWWRNERERVEVSQSLELATLRLDLAAPIEFEELESLHGGYEKNAKLLVELRGRRVALEHELTELEVGSEKFRLDVLKARRQETLGSSFEMLRLANSREFQQVTVLAIDDAGVSIRHLHGSAQLRFSDLNAAQRIQFGLDEELALAAQQREMRNIASYERQIDAQLAVLEVKRNQQNLALERENQLAAQKYQLLLASQRSSASVSPLSKPATTFSNGSYRYSSYRSYRPSYRYVYYQTPTYYRPSISTQFVRSGNVRDITPREICPKRFSETTVIPTP
jgi:hypothetical protein